MGISTRSDTSRAAPNTADSDPACSTQTRESIVAFKLPSYIGLSLYQVLNNDIRIPRARMCLSCIRVRCTQIKIHCNSRCYNAFFHIVSFSFRVSRVVSCRLSIFSSRKINLREKQNLGNFCVGMRDQFGGWPERAQDIHLTSLSALTCWIRRECDVKVSRS